jgi:23S rRNA (adenine2503-C2)-methyltransferase
VLRDPGTDLAELSLAELETLVTARGLPRFRARQIFQWIWKRGATGFDGMSNLPRDLRASLADGLQLSTPAIARHDRSEDGTQKLVLRLHDGRQIECVYIPDTPAQTFCVSTQVGCAMGCAFCLTGKMGLVRNLTAGEIAGQVRVLAAATGLLEGPFNIVLMGMGEPLHNYDATMKALRLLNEPDGFALSPRRVTLSTVGLVPMLDRLAAEPLMPNLAISLHATTEEQHQARRRQPPDHIGLRIVLLRQQLGRDDAGRIPHPFDLDVGVLLVECFGVTRKVVGLDGGIDRELGLRRGLPRQHDEANGGARRGRR